jgi:hypothetical protein
LLSQKRNYSSVGTFQNHGFAFFAVSRRTSFDSGVKDKNANLSYGFGPTENGPASSALLKNGGSSRGSSLCKATGHTENVQLRKGVISISFSVNMSTEL